MRREFPMFRAGLLIVAVMLAAGGLTWLVGSRGGGRGAGGGEAPGLAAAAVPAGAEPAAAPPGAAVCRVAGAGAELPDDVREASGVALGADGVLWTHGDSGEPQVVAVAADGEARGRVRITGAAVEDWEDVATGPCGDGRCLFVADIGDNDARRERITVYRVPEPAPWARASVRAQALHAVYPDGAHDAEALFVAPDGRIFVVTKGESGPIAVYRFPASPRPGAVSRLERVATLAESRVARNDRITGAGASPDGRWVALRTLNSIGFHRLADLTAGRAAEPLQVDLKEVGERQGEGVALLADGTVFLASEGSKKQPAALNRLACTLPR